MRITAAGTVPDSHRIPLHQAASATRLPFPGAKVRTIFDICKLFHYFLVTKVMKVICH